MLARKDSTRSFSRDHGLQGSLFQFHHKDPACLGLDQGNPPSLARVRLHQYRYGWDPLPSPVREIAKLNYQTSTATILKLPKQSLLGQLVAWVWQSAIKERTMKKLSKRQKAIREKVELEKQYSLEEALQLLQEVKTTSSTETVDVVLRLGVDPRKADQMVRGTCSLPHGLGEEVRVLVFAKEKKLVKPKRLELIMLEPKTSLSESEGKLVRL